MQVLIFDGECNVCSRFIRFIVRVNKNSDLYITDFHSDWTSRNVTLDPNADSMIFISNNKKYIYSNSILHLLAETNWVFKPILVFKIIPKSLRDRAYKILAINRKKILKSDYCPMPSKKTRKMFLS